MKPMEQFIACTNDQKANTKNYQDARINYIAWIQNQENLFVQHGYTREQYDQELNERMHGAPEPPPPVAKKAPAKRKAPAKKRA